MENKGAILKGEMERKGKMLENEGETLGNEGPKVKIEADLFNNDETRDSLESKESDPLEHTQGTENTLVKTEREETDPDSINNDPQLHIECKDQNPWIHTLSRENYPQMHTESTEKDPLIKTERENDLLVINPNFSNLDPLEYTESRENNPLVKRESEDNDPLVNNPSLSANTLKCEANTQYPCSGKAVSRLMIRAKVLDYEKNGRQVLESDGVVTYIGESNIWSCPSSESDACYPNVKYNPKEDNIRNCSRMESDSSYLNLEESQEEEGSASNASPNFKEHDSKLNKNRPTRQANRLRNRFGNNSDKLIVNSIGHLRNEIGKNSDKRMNNSSASTSNKVSKQTATEATLKFTCRKCTISFQTKADFTEHLQIHVHRDTREYMKYSQMFAKERDKYLRTKKEGYPKTTTVNTVQECSSSHPLNKHENGLIEGEESEYPTLKRLKYKDYVVEVVCRDCGESYGQGDLKKHSTICEALKKYECQKCDLKFRFKSSFEEHVEIHKYSASNYISLQVHVNRSSTVDQVNQSCNSITVDSVLRSSTPNSTEAQQSSNHSPVVDQVQRSSNYHSTVDQVQRSSNYHSTVDQVQWSSNYHSTVDQVQRSSNYHSTVDQVQQSSNYHSTVDQVQPACMVMNQEKEGSAGSVKKEAQYNQVTIIKPKGSMRSVYMCSTCSIEFYGLGKAMSHSSVHLGNDWCTHLENIREVNNIFQCIMCTKFVGKKLQIKEYCQAVHYHYECLICHKHFVEKSDVNAHHECHYDDITYLITQVVSPWAPKKYPERSTSGVKKEAPQYISGVKKEAPQYNRLTVVKPRGSMSRTFMCSTCPLEIYGVGKVMSHIPVHLGNKWCVHLEKLYKVDNRNLKHLFQCLLCSNKTELHQPVHYHIECLTCHVHLKKDDIIAHNECHDDDIKYLFTQVVSPWAPNKCPEVCSLSPPSFKCQECHQVFDQMPILVSHSVTAHPSKFQWIGSKSTKVMFKCLDCKLNILCQAAYFGHLLAHSGPK